MLAFDLEINKSDGKFHSERRNHSQYNKSSFSFAENVMNEIYPKRDTQL